MTWRARRWSSGWCRPHPGLQIAVRFVAALPGGAHGALHVGVGTPELDGRNPHSVHLFFGAQHVAKRAQCRFGRRVGRLPGGRARVHRRVDEYDVTGGGAQRRQEQLGQLHDGKHVDIKRFPPRLHRRVRYRSRRPDGGTVHHSGPPPISWAPVGGRARSSATWTASPSARSSARAATSEQLSTAECYRPTSLERVPALPRTSTGRCRRNCCAAGLRGEAVLPPS